MSALVLFRPTESGHFNAPEGTGYLVNLDATPVNNALVLARVGEVAEIRSLQIQPDGCRFLVAPNVENVEVTDALQVYGAVCSRVDVAGWEPTGDAQTPFLYFYDRARRHDLDEAAALERARADCMLVIPWTREGVFWEKVTLELVSEIIKRRDEQTSPPTTEPQGSETQKRKRGRPPKKRDAGGQIIGDLDDFIRDHEALAYFSECRMRGDGYEDAINATLCHASKTAQSLSLLLREIGLMRFGRPEIARLPF